MNHTHRRQLFWNSLVIVLGNALYALTVALFLEPAGLVTGGATGIALAFGRLTGLSVSGFLLVFNLAMLVWGWAVLGRAFALNTLASSILSPVFLALWEQLLAGRVLTEDIFLCTVFAGLGIGVALGLVIRAGASTGGMDIPPLILKKLFHLPVSATLYVFDFSILILQMFFSDIEESLYGILLVMIYTFVLDKVLVIGTHQARADIVSSHYEEIRQAIFTRLDRGCTLLNATTGYLQTDQPVLMTVVSRREMASLNQIVMEIDPHAFLIISDANEVKGSGFTSTKIHKKNPNL